MDKVILVEDKGALKSIDEIIILEEGAQENQARQMYDKWVRENPDKEVLDFEKIKEVLETDKNKNKHLPKLIQYHLRDGVDIGILSNYYSRFINNTKINKEDINKFKTFQDFEQLVDSAVETVVKQDLKKVDDKPIFENEEFRVFLGDSKEKAQKYGQGAKYNFCVSRFDGGNLYHSYRKDGATFYFVYMNESMIERINAPAELLVIHAYPNNKYQINYAKPNSDEDIEVPKLLKILNIDKETFSKVFKNKPLTPEEKRLYEEIDEQESILNLKNINDRLLFIELGKEIGNNDWNKLGNQLETLLHKYIEVGIYDVPDNVVDKYPKLKKRYIQKLKQRFVIKIENDYREYTPHEKVIAAKLGYVDIGGRLVKSDSKEYKQYLINMDKTFEKLKSRVKTDKDGNKYIDGDVEFKSNTINKFPDWLKDVRVGGKFSCYNNQLTSLKNTPRKVDGDFNCSYNQLTSLEGAPREVGGHFICSDNQLTSLEGAPREVGGRFNCSYNKLTSLKGAPREVGGIFICSDNQLTSLKGAPREVGGYFDCSYNKLTTLKGAPEEVDGSFFCSNNPVEFTNKDIKEAMEESRQMNEDVQVFLIEDKGALKSIDEIINQAQGRNIIAFDTETTGLHPHSVNTQLTEIAAIAVDSNGNEIEQYHVKINLTPDIEKVRGKEQETGEPFIGNRKIDDNLKMTGYDDKNTKFLDEKDALVGFKDFVSRFPNAFIMAHNLRFDMGQINTKLKQYGLGDIQGYDTIDTLTFARNQLEAILYSVKDSDRIKDVIEAMTTIKRGKKTISHTLDKLGKAFGISTDMWHSGLADTKQLIGIYFTMIEFMKDVRDDINHSEYKKVWGKLLKGEHNARKGWKKRGDDKTAREVRKGKKKFEKEFAESEYNKDEDENKQLVNLQGLYTKREEDIDIDENELNMGIEVEMEHTEDPEVAKRIALDHLMELPDYYTRLNKMEADAEKTLKEAKDLEDYQNYLHVFLEKEKWYTKDGWSGDPEQFDKKRRGKRLFDQSLKNWNDKALGKVKSGTQPDDYNRSLEKAKLKKEEKFSKKEEVEDLDIVEKDEEDKEVFDILSDIETELFSADNLDEYKDIVESLLNRGFEVTGGKLRKQKKAKRKGFRADAGKGNNSVARKMTMDEMRKRKMGAVKGNIKAEGKLNRSNDKKRNALKIRGQMKNKKK